MATFRKSKAKNKSGWVVEVCVNRKRMSKTFATKLEGKNWAAEIEQQLLDGGIVGGKTLGEAFKKYAEEVSPTKKGAKWEITTHMMQHLSQTPALKEKFNAMPIKSGQVLKKQILRAGVALKASVEKEIGLKRYSGMLALDVRKLQDFSIDVAIPKPVVNDDYRRL